MTQLEMPLTTNSHIKVLIVDDHPAIRAGLRFRVDAQPDMKVSEQAADVDEALRKIEIELPDVIVVDIALKQSDGLDLIKELKSRHKNLPILVHSMYDEMLYAERCLSSGAKGFLNKEADPDEVIIALREILRGRIYLSDAVKNELLCHRVGGESDIDPVQNLTNRQLEIFRLIGGGLNVHQIAQRLHISVHTVETHRENIKQKFGITTATELNHRAVLWTSKHR